MGLSVAWEETELWKRLSGRGGTQASNISAVLRLCLNKASPVLAKSGTAPTSFTLHDDSHSFRVAERMTQIIPGETLASLSDYELSLLLAAAFLHDIGMAPGEELLHGLRSYMLFSEAKGLDQTELQSFEEWLDAGERAVTECGLTQPSIESAEETVAEYAREKHGDWAEVWMRKELSSYVLDDYGAWLDDLISLCRSHLEGYQSLNKGRYNPRLVGNPSQVVHLRYLACVLRVADVLEFDPERTPKVVFRQRNISEQSKVFWWKDHHVAIAIEEDRIAVSARPPTAVIHRAIESMCDQMQEELWLSVRLADETHFEKAGFRTADLPYRWALEPFLRKDIKPLNDAYEYIDGSFRLNSTRLLSLFTGTELYEEPLAAVRELLSNAFDAVREQIAWQRLSAEDPNDDSFLGALTRTHSVTLRIAEGADETWLICQDTGVGMSSRIIKDNLLVSGNTRAGQLSTLHREAAARGFTPERAGRFGIGVLSYFMIANQAIIATRRSPEGRDEDGGWIFETDGVGTFGELRRHEQMKSGTEVRLRIRDDLRETVVSDLADYLRRTLVHVPCRFNLIGPEAEDSVSFEPGWCFSDRHLTAALAEDFVSAMKPGDLSSSYLTSRKRASRYAEAATRNFSMKGELERRIRWLETEGLLPNQLGRFRLRLPYFALDRGACLAFLSEQDGNGKTMLCAMGTEALFVESAYGYHAVQGVRYSFEGMAVKYEAFSLPVELSFAEVDFASDCGQISLDRQRFEGGSLDPQDLAVLRVAEKRLVEAFLKQNEASAFALLNHAIAGSQLSRAASASWIHTVVPGESVEWGQMTFPVVAQLTPREADEGTALILDHKQTNTTPPFPLAYGSAFKDYTGNDHGAGDVPVPCVPGLGLPRITLIDLDGITPIGTWPSRVSLDEERHWLPVAGHFLCPFEPLCVVISGRSFLFEDVEVHEQMGDTRAIWNCDHPVVHHLTPQAWESVLLGTDASLDPFWRKQELLSSRESAAAYLLLAICKGSPDYWEGIRERDGQLLEDLWRLLLGDRAPKGHPLVALDLDEQDTLHVVTPETWRTTSPRDVEHLRIHLEAVDTRRR